jgi:hypothetical protein
MAKVVACLFRRYRQKCSLASAVRFPQGFVLTKSISYRRAKGNGAGQKDENVDTSFFPEEEAVVRRRKNPTPEYDLS